MSSRRLLGGLLRTPWATAFGYLGLATGIRSLIHPAFNPVIVLLGPWQWAWAVTYGLGGLLMLLGLTTWRPKLEAAGVCLFIGADLVLALAYVYVPDFSRSVGWPTVLTLAVFAFLASVRLRHIVRGQTLVWVTPSPQER